jgi:hypothetical protein
MRPRVGNLPLEIHAQAAGKLALFHGQKRSGERTDIAADFGSKSFTQAVKSSMSAVTTKALVSVLRAASVVTQRRPCVPGTMALGGDLHVQEERHGGPRRSRGHEGGTGYAHAGVQHQPRAWHRCEARGASGWSQSGTSSVGKCDENSASTAPSGLSKSRANGVNYRPGDWTCGGAMWRTSGLYSLLKAAKSAPVQPNQLRHLRFDHQ